MPVPLAFPFQQRITSTMSDLSITLAGKSSTLQQLPLKQLRDLSIGVTLPDVPDPQEVIRRSYDRAVAIMATALSKAAPELTSDVIYDMTITREEMRKATDAILEFAGLVTK